MMEPTGTDLGNEGAAQPHQPPAQPAAADAEPATFEELGLHADVMSALLAMGFSRPMEVQSRTFGKVMAGRDLMVQSRTG